MRDKSETGTFQLKTAEPANWRLPKPKMKRIRLYGRAEMAHYKCTLCGRKLTRSADAPTRGAYSRFASGKPCPSCGAPVVFVDRVDHRDYIKVPVGYGYGVDGRFRRLASGFTQIPVEMWGKDHWSTFAYIETRVVDYGGVANPQHMRNTCHGAGIPTARCGDKEHPTRLEGQGGASSIDLYGHDDWSCCKDAEAEGLLIWDGTGVNPVFKLTGLGRQVAAKLRQHKQDGGMFHHFEWRREDDVS